MAKDALAQSSKPGVVVRLAGTPSNPMLEVDRTRLADVVDKYIGETEKNLVRLVDVDDTFDSVLLFDEAGHSRQPVRRCANPTHPHSI